MIDIALNCEKGPVSLKDLAYRQGVSIKYLEQIVQALKTAGFIRSIRGASGGYTLARSADNIDVLDIIQALEGSLSPVDCVDMPKICPRVRECVTHEVWRDVQEAINSILSSRTLADLVERQKQKLK